MLLDLQVNGNALTWAADTDKARTSTNIDVGKGLSLFRWKQQSAAETDDHVLSGWFPRGIKALATIPSSTGSRTIH